MCASTFGLVCVWFCCVGVFGERCFRSDVATGLGTGTGIGIGYVHVFAPASGIHHVVACATEPFGSTAAEAEGQKLGVAHLLFRALHPLVVWPARYKVLMPSAVHTFEVPVTPLDVLGDVVVHVTIVFPDTEVGGCCTS